MRNPHACGGEPFTRCYGFGVKEGPHVYGGRKADLSTLKSHCAPLRTLPSPRREVRWRARSTVLVANAASGAGLNTYLGNAQLIQCGPHACGGEPKVLPAVGIGGAWSPREWG